jgi:peptidoglycan/xylan/chitin deacetylase (PgdA/CDA1 family)
MMTPFPIPILMYHSIEKMPKSTPMRGLHVPKRRFALQMSILKLMGYKALSLEKLRPYLNGEKFGKVVGLTFDDGYKNNLINAAPILNKFNFSATCFIVSKHIGKNNIWDLEKGLIQIPLMTEDDISKWINYGMEIGAHSKTHPDLTEITEDDVKKEIKDCKADLEKKFKVVVKDFCYPYGRFNNEICKIVEESGYLSALTMKRGRVALEKNIFQLPRVPITHHTLPHLFILKILTRYEDKR